MRRLRGRGWLFDVRIRLVADRLRVNLALDGGDGRFAQRHYREIVIPGALALYRWR